MPDNKQQERIYSIMRYNKNQHGEDGLLTKAAKVNQFEEEERKDFLPKVINMINELRKQRAVAKWMEQNREHWRWMDTENGHVMNIQQSRGDYSVRRGGADYQQSTPNNQLSDDYSCEDDSDDDFEDDNSNHNYGSDEYPEVVVKNCGVPSINGVYKRIGHCDNAPKYSKTALHEGETVDFLLFRCRLSDNSRRWYISIVPGNSK